MWSSNSNRPGFLLPSCSLTNFEIQKYYPNKPQFNRVYLRNNLPKLRSGAYAINQLKAIN